MKKLITFILISTFFCAFSQTKKDSIIKELKVLTADSGHKFINKSDSTEIIVYRLCESWAKKVNYLTLNLTEQEIADLKNDKNASMNIIGLISELNKNNYKEFAITQLNRLTESQIKFINRGCGDAITTHSIARYYFDLIDRDDLFLQPTFKLTKKEMKNIENKIDAQEFKFWYKID